jgi:hypothetical protein
MGNNIKLSAVKIMRTLSKRPHLFAISLLFTLNTNGQKINKYYSTFPQEKGALYFIISQSEIKSNQDKGSFKFDITHLSVSESITFNFTVILPEIEIIDSITFNSKGGQLITTNATKFYIENAKKELWEHRYSTKLLYFPFVSLYENSNLTFEVITRKGKYTFTPSGKKWEKEKDAFIKIFKMINANK